MLTIPEEKRVIGLVETIEAAGYKFHWNNASGVITPHTSPESEAAVQAIVNSYDGIPQARKLRNAAIRAEALLRIQLLFPTISDFDALELESERWKSLRATAINPTAKYQKLIDIYTAARTAMVSVAGANNQGAIDAVVVNWPA